MSSTTMSGGIDRRRLSTDSLTPHHAGLPLRLTLTDDIPKIFYYYAPESVTRLLTCRHAERLRVGHMRQLIQDAE